MVSGKIKSVRQRLQRREKDIKAGKRAKERRIDRGEPESTTEAAQAKARNVKEELRQTKSETKGLASDAKSLASTAVGSSASDEEPGSSSSTLSSVVSKLGGGSDDGTSGGNGGGSIGGGSAKTRGDETAQRAADSAAMGAPIDVGLNPTTRIEDVHHLAGGRPVERDTSGEFDPLSVNAGVIGGDAGSDDAEPLFDWGSGMSESDDPLEVEDTFGVGGGGN